MMRDLTMNEIAYVSGAEDHSIVVVDPVAAIQTFALLYSVTDQDSFQRASTILGMGVGAIGGGFMGWAAGASSSIALGVCASAGGVMAGAFAVGALARVGSMGAVAIYNTLLG
ncbi:MAG: hypothetical protein AB7V32_05445 [Candidatus Berkiella sp.]